MEAHVPGDVTRALVELRVREAGNAQAIADVQRDVLARLAGTKVCSRPIPGRSAALAPCDVSSIGASRGVSHGGARHLRIIVVLSGGPRYHEGRAF